MAAKTFQTRIKNKIDTPTNFYNFTPLKGEILIGASSNSNSMGSSYIAKVGDGLTKYQNLPVLGQFPFIGSNFTNQEQSLSSGDLILELNFSENIRRYVYQPINTNSNINSVVIYISDTTPMLTEHYVLLDNQGNSDVLFKGIKCERLFNTDRIKAYTKCDYIRAGETCEIPIKIFTIDNVVYIVAIPNYSTGQDYGTVSNDGVWYVNTEINVQ